MVYQWIHPSNLACFFYLPLQKGNHNFALQNNTRFKLPEKQHGFSDRQEVLWFQGSVTGFGRYNTYPGRNEATSLISLVCSTPLWVSWDHLISSSIELRRTRHVKHHELTLNTASGWWNSSYITTTIYNYHTCIVSYLDIHWNIVIFHLPEEIDYWRLFPPIPSNVLLHAALLLRAACRGF